jgi:predicted CoA-binding protein
MSTTKAQIEEFLKLKRIAVVGVSRDEKSYSRMVFRAMAERGYDVVAVNPAGGEMEGRKACATVAEIAPAVEGALVLTPAATYASVAEDCRKAGVAALWFRFKAAGVQGGGIVEDECPLMWLENTEWFHGLHRGLRRLVGTLPK